MFPSRETAGGLSADAPGGQVMVKPMTPTNTGGPSPSPDSHSHSGSTRGFGPSRAPTPQGLKLGSPAPQGSPSVSSGAVMSPHRQQSPGSFSPVPHLPSPASVGSSTGNVPGFNSLGALQALSHRVTQGQESPDRKSSGLQSPLHAAAAQLAKAGQSLEADLFGSFAEQHELLSQEGEHGEGKDGDPDSFGGNGGMGELGDAQNRLLNPKGHTKLLQLLTTKLEPSEPGSPTGDDQSCKDALGRLAGVGGAGHNNYSTSLKEKHKILHRLLQNSTSPVELAKLTAEATGKDPVGPEAAAAAADNMAALGELCVKQEPGSPKKKDNALLRYLLDRDDNGILDKAIKMEPGDGPKLSNVKTEKQEVGFNMPDQVSVKKYISINRL